MKKLIATAALSLTATLGAVSPAVALNATTAHAAQRPPCPTGFTIFVAETGLVMAPGTLGFADIGGVTAEEV